jgi:hypothetical protein
MRFLTMYTTEHISAFGVCLTRERGYKYALSLWLGKHEWIVTFGKGDEYDW